MAETKEVIHKNSQPVKIILQKAREGYAWEIHVSGVSIDEIMPIIRDANNKIKGAYGRA